MNVYVKQQIVKQELYIVNKCKVDNFKSLKYYYISTFLTAFNGVKCEKILIIIITCTTFLQLSPVDIAENHRDFLLRMHMYLHS